MKLPKYGLITFTWVNASGIDLESGLVGIKLSSVEYDAMSVNDMVVIDLDGNCVWGKFDSPSDTSVFAKRKNRQVI